MSASARPARTTREQQKTETRARVFTTAARLFAKHGYHATTIDKIAAEAGVAKGTFFVHFRSKDAVIGELVGIQTRTAREAGARAREGSGPIAALRATVMSLAEQASFSKSLSRGVLSAILESQEAGGMGWQLFEEVFEEMTKDARAAKRAGLLAAHVEASTLAASLIAIYLGALVNYVATPKGPTLVDIIAPLVDASFAGALEKNERKTPKKRPGR